MPDIQEAKCFEFIVQGGGGEKKTWNFENAHIFKQRSPRNFIMKQ